MMSNFHATNESWLHIKWNENNIILLLNHQKHPESNVMKSSWREWSVTSAHIWPVNLSSYSSIFSSKKYLLRYNIYNYISNSAMKVLIISRIYRKDIEYFNLFLIINTKFYDKIGREFFAVKIFSFEEKITFKHDWICA
jgi:hypothetical protein